MTPPQTPYLDRHGRSLQDHTHGRKPPLPEEVYRASLTPRLFLSLCLCLVCGSYRLVAQSIIPGILHGDQQSRLMYGSVEPGARLKVICLDRRRDPLALGSCKGQGWWEASATQSSQVTAPPPNPVHVRTTTAWRPMTPLCVPWPSSLCVCSIRRRRRCSRCWRTCARCCCSPSAPCRPAPSPPRTR